MTARKRPFQTSLTRPSYDRRALKPRILHIGFGAFARAHPLVYAEDVLERTGGDWGTVAVRLHSGADELSLLDASAGLYTVIEADDASVRGRVVGAVMGTCHPRRDGHDALLAHFEEPDLAITSLTITEKGYCTIGGKLDTANSAVAADLANPRHPSTAVGVLAEGLDRRRRAGLGGLTVLSCDNLPENGRTCRAAVTGYAAMRDDGLAEWIGQNIAFPSTMVDRIVPALTDEGRALIREVTGKDDPNGIVTEPFRQWVIEDHFAAGRPDWDLAGAEFVADVRPFEEMKLRMLNGSHSFLAYLGALAGHETIAGCIADQPFRAAVRALMLEEQAPTLSMPEGTDLDAYGQALLRRFANSRLKHRTTQIAADGSQKLPQRLLAPIGRHLADGTAWPRSALAVAGWMHYTRVAEPDSETLPLSDPLASRLKAIARGTPAGPAHVDAMLAIDTVFAPPLAADPRFRAGIREAYDSITRLGARGAVAALAQ